MVLLDSTLQHVHLQVQQALQEAARHRSVMVIAHRLSTVTGADLVAVVQHGAVVEQGTHGSLMAVEGGVYRQLVQRQLFEPAAMTMTDTLDDAAAPPGLAEEALSVG
jgi:ABC-type microcin C transport system duplicated ATPase subunit YejF